MAQQIKFYATTSASYDALVASESVNGAGIYFVEGGELYKGTSRFGLGRVTLASSTAGVVNPARGDIVVTGSGAGWVFDGTNWQSIGGDIGTITSAWQSDISAAVEALVSTFTTGDAEGQVKLGDTNATVNGWSDLVGSVSTNATTIASVSERVTAIENIVDASTNTVTATTGSFSNLSVDSATFNATTVSAGTLTVGGSDISDLISAGADARISAAKLSGTISTSDGAGLVNEGQVVNYVSAQLQSFDNAMHFKGAGTSLPASAEAGDVYVFTANATDESGYKAGQEVVYTGSAWEVIGDQNTYAVAATVDASWSTLGTAAFVNTADTVTADATTLPTCSAVASYVSSEIASAIGALAGSSSDSDKGVAVEVVTADGEVSTVDVTVTLDTTLSANDNNAPTTKAVYDALCWLDASGSVIS
jgi:hypothetical protein